MVQLTVYIKSVRGLASLKPVGAVQETVVKPKKDAKAPTEPVAQPHFYIEVAFPISETPFRSTPQPVNDDSAAVGFSCQYNLVESDTLYNHILTSPIICRLWSINEPQISPDVAGKEIGTAKISVSPFLEGDDQIEGLWSVGGPDLSVNVSLSRHLFTEFEIEQNGRGSISITSLTNVPQCWVSSDRSPDGEEEPNITRFRIGCSCKWPYPELEIKKYVEVQAGQTTAEFGITQEIFFSGVTLQRFFQHITRQDHRYLDIQFFGEKSGNDDVESSAWTRNPATKIARIDLLDINRSAVFVLQGDDMMSDSEASINVQIMIHKPPEISYRSIEEIVPGTSRSQNKVSRPSAEEKFIHCINEMLETISTRVETFAVDVHDSTLMTKAIDGAVQFKFTELLKKPTLGIISSILPKEKLISGELSICDLSAIYRTVSDISSRALSDSLRKNCLIDMKIAPEPVCVMSDRLYRLSREALLLGDDLSSVRYMGQRAELYDVNTNECFSKKMEFISALLNFGSISEAIDELYVIVANNQNEIDPRRLLSMALLEVEPSHPDAASLQRIDAQLNPNSHLALSLRCVGQFMAGNALLAQRNYRRGLLMNIDLLGIAADYAIENSLPQVCQNIFRCNESFGYQNNSGSDWLRRQAHCSMMLKQFELCIERCRFALKYYPGDHRVLKLLAKSYHRIGMYGDAASAFEEQLSYRGTIDPIIYSTLGKYYLSVQRYDAAIEALTKSLVHEKLSVCWKWLGEAFLAVNKSESALDALVQANLLEKYDEETWSLLVIVCLKLGRIWEARHGLNVLSKLKEVKRQDIIEMLRTQVKGAGLFEILPKRLISTYWGQDQNELKANIDIFFKDSVNNV
uniref:Uncharacterized protein n=1 Tax=Spongospora subterranea TaxID=70186 RepID=A0A0H5QWA3_9EUKA|eukprot:CRZ06031.1 hypothetical protein [Spongospora subterranea]